MTKAEVVKFFREGQEIEELVKFYGVNERTIRRWAAEADKPDPLAEMRRALEQKTAIIEKLDQELDMLEQCKDAWKRAYGVAAYAVALERELIELQEIGCKN
jgi:hypothetical protein